MNLLKIIPILFFFLACTPSHQSTDLVDGGSTTDNINFDRPEPPNPNNTGISAEGSGQGREGGHYLICNNHIPLPYKGCTQSRKSACEIEKVFFIDYFLMVTSQQDYNALKKFIGDELAENRVDAVTKRLETLFSSYPSMREKIDFANEFSNGFMMAKGTARWIEDSRSPLQIEVTSDLAPSHLPDPKRDIVEEFCGGRFFQAAVYDFTISEDEVFEYSRFFEDNASEMQKSFRNIHEMLRYVLKAGETQQIQALTYYMHTHEFFSSSPTTVRARLHQISDETAVSNRFH